MTQTEQILTYLKRGGAITPLLALTLFGCMRLGARIWEIKQAGHAIDKRMVEVETRSGDIARVAEYRLEGMGNG